MQLRWIVGLLLAVSALGQAPAATPTTGMLVMLTMKPGVDRAQVLKILHEEVRETARLYLNGKITQWFSRTDGKGVVFIMSSTSVDEAKSLMESLPLAKANLANLEYMPIGPLAPLGLLVDPK